MLADNGSSNLQAPVAGQVFHMSTNGAGGGGNWQPPAGAGGLIRSGSADVDRLLNRSGGLCAVSCVSH